MTSVAATMCATLVDEWVSAGVTDAVVCPGSRSTPLALALAARPELSLHVKLDERSAAFFAIGRSLETGMPTVICTTSGTAAAELHAGVVEAHQAKVPLLVCTADRPPELHFVGAPQTIEQDGLFPAATRWAVAPGVADQTTASTWRPLGARAFAEALSGPLGPGPVHLNLAFREPLVAEPDALPRRPAPAVVRPRGVEYALAEPLRGRGVIIAGGGAGAPSDTAQLAELARTLGWPLCADPRSGARTEGTIAAADAIVRTDPAPAEVVVLLGDRWLSKELAAYVRRCAHSGARVIAVDPWWQWVDPDHVVSEFYALDPDAWVAGALLGATASDPRWLQSWHAMEASAQAAIDVTLGRELSEPFVARALARHASEVGAAVLASASMPMRDLEWYAPASVHPGVVHANRGANGIDGVVSTALGMAASGRRTFALLGDLAFLYDVSGLVNIAAAPCTFVVLDNGGGGIFSFLPQASELDPERFELLFGTRPSSKVADVAAGFGLNVHEANSASALEALFDAPAPSVIRVALPSRSDNTMVHAAINEAVARAIRSRRHSQR